MEFPIEFFLELAWNSDKWTDDNIHTYYSYWANKYFGANLEPFISKALKLYTKYNSRRKSDLLNYNTYNEAENVVNDYHKLYQQTKAIYDTLNPKWKDTFYQLVLHPIEACSNFYELYYSVAKNYQYAQQHRAATNDYAQRVKQLFYRDQQISDYYNHQLSNGKWNHFMDQTHIGYTLWQQPDSNIIPIHKYIETKINAAVGVWPEGIEYYYPQYTNLQLPTLNNLQPSSTFFDIFNQGQKSFSYSIISTSPYIHFSSTKGIINQKERITISVDWNSVPIGQSQNKIIVKVLGKTVEFDLLLIKYSEEDISRMHGFIETNGYIATEAMNYEKAFNTDTFQWKCIENLGRTSSAMLIKPAVLQTSNTLRDAPRLDYQIYCFDTGKVAIQVYLSPTLAFNENKGLSYAIAVDNEKPQIVNIHSSVNYKMWEKMVANNIHIYYNLS